MKAKENLWDFACFRKCGLLLWLASSLREQFPQKNQGEFVCLSIAKAMKNPQLFICNRFCVDGDPSG